MIAATTQFHSRSWHGAQAEVVGSRMMSSGSLLGDIEQLVGIARIVVAEESGRELREDSRGKEDVQVEK